LSVGSKIKYKNKHNAKTKQQTNKQSGATTDNQIQVKLSCHKSLQVIVQTNRNQLQLVYASNHTFISPGTLKFDAVCKHISSHIFMQACSNI